MGSLQIPVKPEMERLPNLHKPPYGTQGFIQEFFEGGKMSSKFVHIIMCLTDMLVHY